MSPEAPDVLSALDAWAAGGSAGTVALGIAAALVLGIRHATDPDHLTALATLVASEGTSRDAAGARLGLAWGAGHALTLLGLGTPVLLVGRHLPAGLHGAAEVAVGAVIVVLSVRLLARWRRGRFHAHPHDHDGVRHAHPHFHEERGHGGRPHSHAHGGASPLGRSPLEAFGIGLIHGVGGSGGAGVLLVTAIPETWAAATALVIFASGTALSMTLATLLLRHALERRLVAERMELLVPPVGVLSLLFGVWYAAGAAGALPYPF